MSYPAAPKIDRFMDKVSPEPMSGCWLWTAHAQRYGYFSWDTTTTMSAHRASWMLAHGDIPEGMCVLHKCDNGLCVNPRHLFLGTHDDNMADMARKDRAGKPHAKLTPEAIHEIRTTRRKHGSRLMLARKYGVSVSTITYAMSGKTWKNLEVNA